METCDSRFLKMSPAMWRKSTLNSRLSNFVKGGNSLIAGSGIARGTDRSGKEGLTFDLYSSHDRHSLPLSPYHYHSQTKLHRTRYRLMTIVVRATVNKSMLVRGSLQPVAGKLLYPPLRSRYPISRLHLRLNIQLYFLVSLSVSMNRQNIGSL